MPLTPIQKKITSLLASVRSFDSHLAGGAAILLEPNTQRYSYDLDYFQDSAERVAEAYKTDVTLLETNEYTVATTISQPGFVQTLVTKEGATTKVEWSHDSAWRFLPAIENPEVGYVLHPIDLAINKLLALVGRNEPRDFLDTLFVAEQTLSLGALCWAASGKDPGYTPQLLLEMLRRKGVYREEDFTKLNLTEPIDISQLKQQWLTALDQADAFIKTRYAQHVGCLYYSSDRQLFLGDGEEIDQDETVITHFGQDKGIWPTVK